MDRDARTRARLERHCEAPDRGDIDTEHAIYAADAVLDYREPQHSGLPDRGPDRVFTGASGHPRLVCPVHGGRVRPADEVTTPLTGHLSDPAIARS